MEPPICRASTLFAGPIMVESRLLKKDLFGEIRAVTCGDDVRLVRDAGVARPGLRWLARQLLRREARALAALDGLDGFPALLVVSDDRLERRFIAGVPMHRAQPRDPRFFKAAAALLRRLHRAGVVHNDLAKEPNLLVTSDGRPAFSTFSWHGTRNVVDACFACWRMRICDTC